MGYVWRLAIIIVNGEPYIFIIIDFFFLRYSDFNLEFPKAKATCHTKSTTIDLLKEILSEMGYKIIRFNVF